MKYMELSQSGTSHPGALATKIAFHRQSANLTVQFVRAEFIELLTDYTLAFEEVGRALQ